MTFLVIVMFYAAACCSALPSPGSAELWLGNGTQLSVNDSSSVEGLVVTDNTPTSDLAHTMYDPVRNVVYLSAKWAIQQVEFPRGVLTTPAFFKDEMSFGLLLLGRKLFMAHRTNCNDGFGTGQHDCSVRRISACGSLRPVFVHHELSEDTLGRTVFLPTSTHGRKSPRVVRG